MTDLPKWGADLRPIFEWLVSGGWLTAAVVVLGIVLLFNLAIHAPDAWREIREDVRHERERRDRKP